MKTFARALLPLFLAIACGTASADTPAERRTEIQKRTKEVLTKLYSVRPSAKGAISSAYGYAVFTNLGINLVLISAAGGNGLAHNNKTGKSTYMKMISGGVGL